MRDKRKDDCGQDRGSCCTSGEAEAVRSRAPGDEGGHGYGQKFKEERELGLKRGGAEAAEQKRTCAEPVPGLAGQVKDVAWTTGQTGGCASQAAGQSCADESENDGGNGHDGQAAEERLSG